MLRGYSKKGTSPLLLPDDHGKFVTPEGNRIEIGEDDRGNILTPSLEYITAEERLNVIERVGTLPVTLSGESIRNAIEDNDIVIIQAETGSGKSTQIPKMLQESYPGAKIVVTQPRIMAAIEIAKRVSHELICYHGASNFHHELSHPHATIGYRTGEGASSIVTRPLSFHTDALEFERQGNGIIPNILVIDEAHKFNRPIEMIVAQIRRLRNTPKYKHMKIVIMSATIAADKFVARFESEKVATLKITGRTYPIKRYHNPKDNPVTTIASLVMDKSERTKEDDKPKKIDEEKREAKNVLVFCSGKRDIYDLIDALQAELGDKVDIFPLHADVSAEDRSVITAPGPHPKPRIIISTNIAQESVTIPYIQVVYTFGKVKKVGEYDGVKNISEENTTQFDDDQQAGRSGRTSEGVFVRNHELDYKDLLEEPRGEIEEATLYREILQLARSQRNIPSLNLKNEIKSGNNNYFVHPVNRTNLDYAYRELQLMGAIDKQGDITMLGYDMLQFPLSVHNARILCEAIQREKDHPGCIQDIVPLLAIQEIQSFVSKEGSWKEKAKSKNDGDLFALSSLLSELSRTNHTQEQLKEYGKYGVSREDLTEYSKLHPDSRPPLALAIDLSVMGIKMPQLRKIIFMIDRLKAKLLHLDIVDETIFEESNKIQKENKSKQDNLDIIKICLATGALNHVYSYNPKEKRFIRQGFEKGDVFQIGNSSLLDLERLLKMKGGDKSLFIGQPFIINQENADSLAIITNITPIDQGILDEALHQSLINYDNFSHGNYTEDAKRTYEHRKIEHVISTRRVKDPEEKRRKFVQTCLPYFLIEHNPHIRKRYLSYTQESKEYFVETILPAHLNNYEYLIDPASSIETIEDQFWNATIIDFDLGDSDDEIIRNFVQNPEKIPENTPRKYQQENPKYNDPDSERMALEERMTLIKDVVTLEGTVRGKMHDLRGIALNLFEDFKQIKTSRLRERIYHSENLKQTIDDFFSMDIANRSEILHSIKEYESKFKARTIFFKQQLLIQHILNMISSDDWKEQIEWIGSKLGDIESETIKEKIRRVCTWNTRGDTKREARLESYRQSTIKLIRQHLEVSERTNSLMNLPESFHKIKGAILEVVHHGDIHDDETIFTRVYVDIFIRKIHALVVGMLRRQSTTEARDHLLNRLDQIEIQHFARFEGIAGKIQNGIDAVETMENILSFGKDVKNGFQIEEIRDYYNSIQSQEHGIDKYISILSAMQDTLKIQNDHHL